jgi:outer membrane receptor protein involved in Fe transport
VRGLGERYSSALLNGSPLPSPEPLQRVVPLDLFPSSILANVLVQKTYSANFPGEFGGGVIALTTINVPVRPFLSIGLSTGGNTETTLKDGIGYFGSETDWLGFDDGTRELPDELRLALQTGRRINETNFTSDELRRIGTSFVNAPLNLLQKIEPEPNFGLDVSAGVSADTGLGRFGVVGVIGYDNSWSTRTGVQQVGTLDQGQLRPIADYDFTSTQQNVDFNALLGFGLEADDHEIRFTNLFVRSTIKEARIREGVDTLFSSNLVRDDFTEFFVRTLVSHQLTGEHEFGDLSFDWRAAYAKASRDSPYEKRLQFEQSPQDQRFRTDARRNRNQTRFSEIEDQVWSGGFDLGYRFTPRPDVELNVSTGYAYLDNDRNFESREFRFIAEEPLSANQQLQRPDFFFADPNIGPNALQIVETTGQEGAAAFDAQLEVHAAYVQGDLELGENIRASAGVRYEDGEQIVRPFDLFGGTTPIIGTRQEQQYYLPAATLTYLFADGDMQVRFGASKTIARPQFRELAPSQFIDVDTDRVFFGNPFLRDSELTNYDARYEWYFGARQFLTAGLFFKTIDSPVEQILNVQGGEVQTTFLNAPKADLYGAEVEVRKYFELPRTLLLIGSKRFLVGANYTFTRSELKVEDGDVVFPFSRGGEGVAATDFFIDGQSLQGQSDHLANLQLGLEDRETGSQATLLLNYASERVSARGGALPDALQDPGVQLDLNVRKAFKVMGREFTLGFEARNLLDEDSEEFQELGGDRIDLNRFDLGRSFSISFGATFGG